MKIHQSYMQPAKRKLGEHLEKFLERMRVACARDPVKGVSQTLNGDAKNRLGVVHAEGPWMFRPDALNFAADLAYSSIQFLTVNAKKCARNSTDFNIYIIVAEVIVFIRETVRHDYHLEDYYMPWDKCFPFVDWEESKIDDLLNATYKTKMLQEFKRMLTATITLMASATETNWRDAFSVLAHFRKHGTLLTSLTTYYNFGQAISKHKTASSVHESQSSVNFVDRHVYYSNRSGEVQYIKSMYTPGCDFDYVCKKCQNDIETLAFQATLKCLQIVIFLEECRKGNLNPWLTSFVYEIPGKRPEFTSFSFAKLLCTFGRLVKQRCCKQELSEFRMYNDEVKRCLQSEIQGSSLESFYKEFPYVHLGPHVLGMQKTPTLSGPGRKTIQCQHVDKQIAEESLPTVDFLSRTFASNYSQVYTLLEDILRDQDLMHDRSLLDEFTIFGMETMVWNLDTRQTVKEKLCKFFTLSSEGTDKALLSNNEKIGATCYSVFENWIRTPSVDLFDDYLKFENRILKSINEENEENGLEQLSTNRKRKARSCTPVADSKTIRKCTEEVTTSTHSAIMENLPLAPRRAQQFQRKAEMRTLEMVCRIGSFITPGEGKQFCEITFDSEEEKELIQEIKLLRNWNPQSVPGGPRGSFKRYFDPLNYSKGGLTALIKHNGEHLTMNLARSFKSIALDRRLLSNRTAFCSCHKCRLVCRLKSSHDNFSDFCCREVLQSDDDSIYVQNFKTLLGTHKGCITELPLFWKSSYETVQLLKAEASSLKKNSRNYGYAMVCGESNISIFKGAGFVASYKDRHLPTCVVAAVQELLQTPRIAEKDDEDNDDDSAERSEGFASSTEEKEYEVKYANPVRPGEEKIFRSITHPRMSEMSAERFSLADALKAALDKEKFCKLNVNVDDETLLCSVPKKCDINVFVHTTFSQLFLIYAWKPYTKEFNVTKEERRMHYWELIAKRSNQKLQSAIFLKLNEDNQYNVIFY